MTEKQLLRRVARGDVTSFEELHRLHRSNVYGRCLQILKEPERAEDAANRTFHKLWTKAQTFRGDCKLSGWLYRIASNEALMMLRESSRLTRFEQIDESTPEPVSSAPGSLKIYTDAELRKKLSRAVKRLPDIYRVTFILIDVEGLSSIDAACALGVPVSTIKPRLHRARVMLRSKLLRNAKDWMPEKKAANG